MTMNFPEYAIKCLNIIENASFEAYFVGGCVRDWLLGRKFNDIDIATNAEPNEIVKLFEHTIPTGIKHGTVTVIINGFQVEVTTYRTDGLYADTRHPTCVKFESDIKYDLSRRDFTINAMAYNPKHGLLDLFGGINDISNKIIRTVGDPYKRFSEDALRILRAFRFSSTLNFSIEGNTLLQAKKLASLIDKISGERVLEEIYKLSSGVNPHIIVDFINNRGLKKFGILGLEKDIETLDSLVKINCDRDMKTALFISVFSHDLKTIKERLKPNNRLYKFIGFLDQTKSCIIKNKHDIKLLLYKYGYELVELFICHAELSDNIHAKNLRQYICDIETNKEPYNIHHLKINGKDLKELGYFGEDIGMLLDRAIHHVINQPEDNLKDKLISIIKN